LGITFLDRGEVRTLQVGCDLVAQGLPVEGSMLSKLAEASMNAPSI
jgi:hypothetical protein